MLIPIRSLISFDKGIRPIISHELTDTLITTLWHWIATPLPTRHSQKHHNPQMILNTEAVP